MVIRPVSTLAALVMTMGSAIVLTPPVAVVSSAISHSIALAQLNQPKRAEARGWLKELNLSSEQIQKIRQIRSQYQGRLTQQRRAAQQAQRELKELMAGNASTEQVRQKFDQVQRLRQELSDTRMESMLAIRKVLNPEQRQKLADLMRQRGNSLGGL
ncbi:Spy/CpxP family protein refolding chaperone [Leptodesmis sichuanensis]|uniref:Spy/CpxP family protein refolding chaperone n=1 Tax=Leptodesmis sichuanensis TaxID=2906798 RepID=UPI001F269CA4|nr:Spy/CpxP family protein refolding chaperone [Leptodesmis sichuanensis]UIE38779.1 Spy/CpxP family protein refolding chaperone [Leptodesmis sichuanensis A121]